MAHVLCVLASARKKGYSAALLECVVDGINSVKDVTFEIVHITEHLPISPCMSCWSCYRNDDHRCILTDSMGTGKLVQKIVNANALFIAQPVYYGRPPASVNLFFERFYPFMWSGELNGMPFASLSQAANNGGARLADQDMARWASTFNLKYIGGLPVHMVYFEEAKIKARDLGRKIAEAAICDAEGRQKTTQLEKFLGTQDNPWGQLESYIDNITNGTYNYEDSLIEYALSHGSVKREDAIDLLRKASEELKLTLHHYKLEDHQKATEHLVKMKSFWSQATIMEFLEDELRPS